MFPFTLRQLEVFQTLCETSSFQDAASRLGISQPSVSHQIRALEAQLGVDLLLRRRGRRPLLSPEGMKFRRDLDAFLESGRSLAANRRSTPLPPTRPIKIFVGPHLFEDYLRPELPRFHETHPDIVLEFLPSRTQAQLLGEMRKGLLDLGVTSVPDRDFDLEGAEIIGAVGAGLYVHRDLIPPEATPESISNLPFILPLAGVREERGVLEILANRGVIPRNVVARSQYFDVNRRMLLEGRGALFTFSSVVQHLDATVIRRIVKTPDWYRLLYVNPELDRGIATRLKHFMLQILL